MDCFFAVLLMFVIGYGNGASALTFAVVRHSFDVREVGSVSGFANTGGFLIPAFFSLFGVLGTVMIREKTRAGESQAA